MNSVIQIASALEVPSPGLLALAGMGTVFVSLTLIYLIMAVMSKYLHRVSRVIQSSGPLQESSRKEEAEKKASENIETKEPQIAIAIAVALAKHRRNKVKHLFYKAEGGINPWKLSGRIRALRK